jgi:gliding motility-associated-like protein
MKKIHLTLIAFMLFFIPHLLAQDLTGLWQGVSYKKGTTDYYVLTLTLKQAGINVTGSGLTKLVNDSSYAIQSVKGTVNNNVLTFQDITILDSLSTFYWCMRYGDLTYDPVLEKLYGVNIETTNCKPSLIEMELYRLKIYADTVICGARNVPIRATGKNLRWYKDSTKRNIIFQGNAINPYVTSDTTFYVTQTIYDTESPAVPIKIYFNGRTKKQNFKICDGQSVTVLDTIYKTSGTYTRHTMAINGCDSLIVTNVTVNPSPKTQQNINLCAGQMIMVADTVYNTTGIYHKILKTIEGCDSTLTTNLRVTGLNTFSQTLTICAGEKIVVGDATYRTTGRYVKNLLAISGCDSLVTTDLTVKPISQSKSTLTICEGESVIVGDTIYKTSGTYTKKLKNTDGCDSLVTTNLKVNKIIKKNHNITICEGENFIVGDTTYRTTGIYVKKYQTISGCDSVIVTNLTVNSIQKTNQELRLCNGKSVTVGYTVYKTDGTYFKKLSAFSGCDSIVISKIKIINEITFLQKLTICEGSSVSVGDTIYRTNGIFIKKLRSTEGCDSLITTNLSVVKFDLQISNDTILSLGDSTQISAIISVPLDIKWKWTPNVDLSCDTCSILQVKPKISTRYQVETTDKISKCSKKGQVFIKVKDDCALFAPNTFSPNGDNNNDKWMIFPSNCVKFIKRVAIFNRWGNLIIAKNNITLSTQGIEIWDGFIDGRIVDNDTFVYVIEAEYTNGKQAVIGGDFTVIK